MELAPLDSGALAVRDTKAGPDGPILTFAPDEFAGFLGKIKQGGLDLH